MNILYTTDDNFIPQTSAGICSVCENNKDASALTFYIFSLGISAGNQKALKELAAGYGRAIDIIEMNDLSSYFDFSFDTTGWNPIVLARLLLEKLLPKSVERILYLDGDTIVRGNLKSMWETNMRNCVIGGCIEPTVNKKQLAMLQMEHIPYINAGVLLIDLQKWRAEGTGQRIIDFYARHNGRLFANDQDAINGALKGEIFYLPPKYNFYNIYYLYPYKMMKKLMGDAFYFSLDIYQESLKHPAIIHYLGEERPWRMGNRHPYKKDYEAYLEKASFSSTPMEQGWDTYFKCFYLFHRLLKPFPMLRYQIITALIPAFLKSRARKRKKQAL